MVKHFSSSLFRGCSFVSKVKTVENHGAIAVFIADNHHDNGEALVDMVHDGTKRDVHIPAGFMLGSDGWVFGRWGDSLNS